MEGLIVAGQILLVVWFIMLTICIIFGLAMAAFAVVEGSADEAMLSFKVLTFPFTFPYVLYKGTVAYGNMLWNKEDL